MATRAIKRSFYTVLAALGVATDDQHLTWRQRGPGWELGHLAGRGVLAILDDVIASGKMKEQVVVNQRSRTPDRGERQRQHEAQQRHQPKRDFGGGAGG